MNKVILTGTTGKDPEIKIFENGTKVANFSLATNERWKDKSGNKMESTEWHNIVAFGKLAELSESYIKKGMRLMIIGKIKTRSWEGQDGKKYITEIHMEEIEFPPKPKEENQKVETLTQPDTTETGNDLPF